MREVGVARAHHRCVEALADDESHDLAQRGNAALLDAHAQRADGNGRALAFSPLGRRRARRVFRAHCSRRVLGHGRAGLRLLESVPVPLEPLHRDLRQLALAHMRQRQRDRLVALQRVEHGIPGHVGGLAGEDHHAPLLLDHLQRRAGELRLRLRTGVDTEIRHAQIVAVVGQHRLLLERLVVQHRDDFDHVRGRRGEPQVSLAVLAGGAVGRDLEGLVGGAAAAVVLDLRDHAWLQALGFGRVRVQHDAVTLLEPPAVRRLDWLRRALVHLVRRRQRPGAVFVHEPEQLPQPHHQLRRRALASPEGSLD